MRLGAAVGHGVDGQGDVETGLVGLARGGFDARAGRDADHHHLGHAQRLQPGLEIGGREGAPGPFGDDDVARLLLKLGDEFGEVRREGAHVGPGLFRASRRAAGDIDQHHRKVGGPEGAGQGLGPFEHLGDRMRQRRADDALLQVDHQKGGVGVKDAQGHGGP